MFSDCARCYLPLNGRVIHDEALAWHDACRVKLIRELAAEKADLQIRQNLDQARVLADIQRDHLQVA